jgi:hypothetical protein
MATQQFKIGDRVRFTDVLGNRDPDKGTITSIDADNNIWVKWDSDGKETTPMLRCISLLENEERRFSASEVRAVMEAILAKQINVGTGEDDCDDDNTIPMVEVSDIRSCFEQGFGKEVLEPLIGKDATNG